MARFIAEDVLIVLVSCCLLLFEGGWERDGAVDLRSMPRHQDFNSVCIFCFRQEFLVLLYHPVDGTDGFQEECFFDLAEKTFALKRGTSHPSIALV